MIREVTWREGTFEELRAAGKRRCPSAEHRPALEMRGGLAP